MVIFPLLCWLLFYVHSAFGVANLKYFETLSHVTVTSSIKRSADGTRDLFKRLMFRAFERDFDLTLKSGTNLKAKDFRARLVNSDGSSSILYLDESLIFSGHLTDKPNVSIQAHIEDSLWSIHIFDHEDIYAVEPAWRLLTPSENPRNDTLIAYRASDLTSDSSNSSQFCGVQDHKTAETQSPRADTWTQASVVAQTLGNYSKHSPDIKGSRTRGKRLSAHGVACILYLVGDYTFYKGRCKGNHQACLALMFSFVHLADTIFKTSVFEKTDSSKFLDVGLEVGEVILFSSYTVPASSHLSKHFNEKQEWTVGAKLDAFAEYTSYMTYHKKVCASHLFTDYPFPGRVLGLAWMMTVCLEVNPGVTKKNSGLTSGTESTEGAIPSLQMNLVFVHERSTVLAFCGNGIVDQNEQCDAGSFGVIDTNPCCTNDCKFRAHASCSDLNQACCKNCSISPEGTLCLSKDLIECEEASYCTGKSYDCPDPHYLEDWTRCKDRGQCYRGICRSFCETISIKEGKHLKGCLCQTNDDGAACKWCCYDSTDPNHPGPCLVHTNETVHDGRPCFLGYCKSGVCDSNMAPTILRLYHYLPPLGSSKTGSFIRSNIVASVVLMSLIIWLPGVVFVYLKDRSEKGLRKRLTMEFQADAYRRRTSEYKARKQRRKRKRDAREAASPSANSRQKSRQDSFLFELRANEKPQHGSMSLAKDYNRQGPQKDSPRLMFES